MDKGQLAEDLRERRFRNTVPVSEEDTDEEVVRAFVTCGFCGEQLVVGEDLDAYTTQANDTEDFLSLVSFAHFAHGVHGRD